jgi:phosphatidylcholine synthase
MNAKAWAALAHVFTALGIIPAFFALIAVSEHRYEAAFAWLGAAFIIDGLDGPFARYVGTKQNLPRFCGERLDLIIDYITYVAVPAYMVYQAELSPDGLSAVAACLILLTSLYHFSDTGSKTEDGYFVGFPAIWNVVVFYFFVSPPGDWAVFIIVMALSALTFSSSKWVHPVRVKAWRHFTLAAAALWAVVALYTVFTGFPAETWAQAILAAVLIYGLALCATRSLASGETTSQPNPAQKR